MNTTFAKCWFVAILTVVSLVSLSAADTPFSITITTPKDAVEVGSQVTVAILVKNVSDRDISFSRSPAEDRGELFTEVEVQDADNNPLPGTEYYRLVKGKKKDRPKEGANFEPMGFHGSVIQFTLKPGETLKDGVVVSKLFDLGQPGRYSIRVTKVDMATKTSVTSNTITVTMVEVK